MRSYYDSSLNYVYEKKRDCCDRLCWHMIIDGDLLFSLMSHLEDETKLKMMQEVSENFEVSSKISNEILDTSFPSVSLQFALLMFIYYLKVYIFTHKSVFSRT